MNVASLELSKELYAVSGWNDTYMSWDISDRSDMPFENVVRSDEVIFSALPAYDLGYLVRKLPEGTSIRHIKPYNGSHSYWAAEFVPNDFYGGHDDNPEDAAAKLAIELFKQGILTKEEPHA